MGRAYGAFLDGKRMSIDERGDAGRDAQPHRPRGQRTLRVHAQLHRSDRDSVLVVIAEVGGVQDAGFGSRSGCVELDPGTLRNPRTDLDVLGPAGKVPPRASGTPRTGMPSLKL